MERDFRARRRWFGSLALLAALAMLIGGETDLKGRLSALNFLVYWLVCFALTTLALFVAFLDVRAVRRRIRQEERDLLDRTLQNIQKDAKGKRPG